ncbi:unnamed protein product, partial [Vitis vinifera]|uniref:Uncharacterized protein n=1 Tax=Vitis vinifera TaxID=29760 RepID=D7SWU6_VITVI
MAHQVISLHKTLSPCATLLLSMSRLTKSNPCEPTRNTCSINVNRTYQIKIHGLTERLFMKRYSTSSTESLAPSAMIFNGMVPSSEGRLQDTISQLNSAITL